MHQIFGIPENVRYFDRKGAYLIPVKGNCVGVIQTPKGYFLLGGGLDEDESDEACIVRECMEEAGYTVCVGEKICSAEMYAMHPTIGYFHPIQTYYAGKLLEQVCQPVESDHRFCWIAYEEICGRMFSPMQSWALEQCYTHLNGI